MTEMMTRAECPDCGRDVAVNKDGSLRKHDCMQPETTPTAVEPAAEPEPMPASTPPRQRRRCSEPGCDRLPSVNDKCPRHWRTRGR